MSVVDVLPDKRTSVKRSQEGFLLDDYEVKADELSSGGSDISITKGGVFKAVLGMKTALKITLLPLDNKIYFEAGVGIWGGQQSIPTVISMLFFRPVLITQIWGLMQQSKLDDKALAIAEEVIALNGGGASAAQPAEAEKRFCTSCGSPNAAAVKFCSNCGSPL